MDESDRKKRSSGSSFDVWEDFVAGDTSCFEKLFKKNYKEMYGYGLKLCNTPELVKDCIQELFKIIWERKDALAHIDSPRVYMFVSLRRIIFRKLKKESKSRRDVPEVCKPAEICFGIEEVIVKNEEKFQQKEALHQALNQLSNRQKEVIYLHFYNGMSYREIEKILFINRQSVRNYMYRAMETLRVSLENEALKWVVMLVISCLFSFPA